MPDAVFNRLTATILWALAVLAFARLGQHAIDDSTHGGATPQAAVGQERG